MATTYITASDGTKLDAGVVALARGIKQQESGGNYQAVGDNGTSHGAYQWQPGNFQAAATKYGLNPNDLSPVNQDKVAYQQILDYKNQGLTPDRVAAAWNAGISKAKSGAWQTNVGTTTIGGKPIAYDTPTYVKNVLNYYDQNKQQILGSNTSDQSSQTPQADAATGAPEPTPDAAPSVSGFLGNIASSAGNLISGLGSAIAHPIKTVENLGNTAIGGVENALNKVTGSTYDNAQTQTAANVGNYFAKRYGGSNPGEIAQNILKTAYKDPVGVALDLSTLLDGVGAGVGAVGGIADASKASELVNATAEGVKAMTPEAVQAASTPGTLSQIGGALKTAGKYTNPIGLAGSGIGAIAPKIGGAIADVVGGVTGVGGGVIRQAARATTEGGDAGAAFVDGLKGATTPDEIVGEAKDALQSIVNDRSSTYQQMLSNIKTDSTTYDISPVIKEIDNQLNNMGITKNTDGTLDFSNSKIRFDSKSQGDINTIYDQMKTFGTKPGQRTAVGIDNLKQAFYSLDRPSSAVRSFTTGVSKATRAVLDDTPGYTKAMRAYADQTDSIDEIRKGLSLGDKASVETSFKKITSALRNNNEYRKQFVQALDDATGGQLLPKIAGQQMNSLLPRGLVGTLESAGGPAAVVLHPAAAIPLIATALATSPRIAANIIRALGFTAKQVNTLVDNIGKLSPALKPALIQALKVGTESNKIQSTKN